VYIWPTQLLFIQHLVCADLHIEYSKRYVSGINFILIVRRSGSEQGETRTKAHNIHFTQAVPKLMAVSRWLHIAAAQVQARVRSRGICGGQNNAGTDFFSRVLRFLLPLIPPIAPNSSSIYLSSRAGKIGQIVANVPSGLHLTPPQETRTTFHTMSSTGRTCRNA
jgi:hypothetical protein